LLGTDPGGREFGLIQSEFHAEPLGLLRWTTITAADLTPALDLEFARVGPPVTRAGAAVYRNAHRPWQRAQISCLHEVAVQALANPAGTAERFSSDGGRLSRDE
jgi:hypothetical protein